MAQACCLFNTFNLGLNVSISRGFTFFILLKETARTLQSTFAFVFLSVTSVNSVGKKICGNVILFLPHNGIVLQGGTVLAETMYIMFP